MILKAALGPLLYALSLAPFAYSEPMEPTTEAAQTRANLSYWTGVMARHGYSLEEVAAVCAMTTAEHRHSQEAGQFDQLKPCPGDTPCILPYPGGRHPRIGFLEGAINPMRGTKASIFLPWNATGYAVIDLPEAIFCNLGLLFLAHTHVPTIWDQQGEKVSNIDWTKTGDSLHFERVLPNGVKFGAAIKPEAKRADCEIWLTNGTSEKLTGLRTQVCLMLKGAQGFNEQSRERKVLDAPVAAVKSMQGNRWILTAFDHCGRVWENPKVPCIHSDPVLPDAAPGETVRVKGCVWFYEGENIQAEITEARGRFSTTTPAH
jgi:hypothetical protein